MPIKRIGFWKVCCDLGSRRGLIGPLEFPRGNDDGVLSAWWLKMLALIRLQGLVD